DGLHRAGRVSAHSRRPEDPAPSYGKGTDRDRLAAGQGALELARTQALLERYLPAPPAVVADVGGGPGRYAVWLAKRGYRVHLVDPVPLHVEQARAAAKELAGAEVGDARALGLSEASVDAGLLMGPLYHLPERGDRLQALAEARRVCRRGGVIVAAGISRFASTLDGLRAGYLEDPAFASVAAGDRQDGRHRNPTGDPAYFTTAYFHRPEDLAAECAEAGLAHDATLAVEGAAWLLSDLDARLADARRRAALLAALDALESEPALLGVSAHLLAVARRAWGVVNEVRNAARDGTPHVVLVHPEIHWNPGNAGRTCLAAGATLHLIEPLGFSLDAREVKRAGLDYWEHLDLRVW